MNSRFYTIIRAILLGSRWLMAPFFLGLIAALLVLLAQFFRDLTRAVIGFAELGGGELVVTVLKLVDLVLIANLVLMIVAAGAEAFVPRSTEDAKAPPDGGAALVDFAGLKLKVFASLSAIAAVDLLESSINFESMDKARVFVEILILLAFVVSGLLLAWMDRLAAERH